MIVRRVLLAVFAAVWAVTAAAPVSAAVPGRPHAGLGIALRSAAPGTSNLGTDTGAASRLLRSRDAIDVKALTKAVLIDDDDVDIDTDESKRSGHERYSAVLPRAPDAALDTIATPHLSRVASLVLSASVACPQGRAPPSLLS
jgi:hypothetical protein